VVVLVGATLAEPDTGRAAALTLGLMLTEVASVLVQVSVAVWPLLIAVGVAANVTVGGGPAGGATVIVTANDAVPPAPVAVIV
jgi:hypothetical protein